MPLISNFYKNNGFFDMFTEAEADGQPIEGNEEAPADYTAEDTEPQEAPQEESQDQGGKPQDGQEPPVEGEEEPTDYTDMGDEGGEGEPPADGGGEAPPEEEAPVDELKSQEEEMYANLTPEQLDVKHKELKTRFLDMYDMTLELVDRIGDAIITEENIGVIEYVSKNLNSLRTMLSDYVSSIYSTKSYTENSINYNRFLAVLNGINKMLEQIPEKEKEE